LGGVMRRPRPVTYGRGMSRHDLRRRSWRPPDGGESWAEFRGRRRRAFGPMLLAVIQVFGSLASARWHPEARPLDAFGVCLLLVAPFVLLWRRAQLVGA